MPQYGVQIRATGSYAPERILTNHDLEKMVDTSDEWIRTRTGISERHIADPDEPTSALAAHAARRALDAAGMGPEELQLVIVGTLSGDALMPNTGCHVQQRLGAINAACFSLEAACSGFLYGLQAASDMIRSGTFENALVIGAEKLSTYTDWTDRNTCVLFGDGAGAVILQRTDADNDAILASRLGADGRYSDLLCIPAGGTALPLTHQLLDERMNFIKMRGREVFKLAVSAMAETSEAVLQDAGVSIDDVRWLVPHQANTRIILAVGKRLSIPEERVFMNLERYGNTSAATIPIALDEIVSGDLVERGDHVLLTAFGGGLTWGSVLVKW